jgi:outer membrane protein OmpA-like peptidoglycan-associated protein
MKALFLSLLLFLSFSFSHAQKYVGPPNNVGREYGNPKMPLMVSHLAGANKKRLERAGKNSKHFFLAKVLCFRRLCRIQSGHTASLRAISFSKFRKKIARNAKKGMYKKMFSDSTLKSKPVKPIVREAAPIAPDTITLKPISMPIVKADSLIVLGAELLFETNKSTLRSDHFAALNPIVEYLILHPERLVKISGHTDNTGSKEYNLTLSKKRADVVAEYLVGNGVDISRVETFGFGSEKPLVKTNTDEGRKKNRRVELLIHDE